MVTNPYKQGTSAYTIWEQGYNHGALVARKEALGDQYFEGFNEGMSQGHEAAMARLSSMERQQLLASPTAMKLIEYAFEIIAWEAEKYEAWAEEATLMNNLRNELWRAVSSEGKGWADPRLETAHKLYSELATHRNYYSQFLWDHGHEFNNKLATAKGREELFAKFQALIRAANDGASTIKRREGRQKAAELVLERINNKTLQLSR